MKKTQQFAVILEKEEQGCVAVCPELDIASKGKTLMSHGTIFSEPSSSLSNLDIPRKC